MEIIKHGDKLIERNSEFGYWRGDIPVDVPDTTDLEIRWEANPMSAELFREILSFFKYTYDEHNAETQLRLYYHRTNGTWKAVAMPQFLEGSSLHVEEDEQDPRWNDIIVQLVADGWCQMGSAHHHCGASAFQSGTDLHDEIDTNGFHYTIGNLNSPKATLHTRAVLRGVVYEDVGDQFLPYTDDILSLKNLPAFDQSWLGMLKEKPKPVYNWGNYNFGSTHKFGNTYNYNTRSSYQPMTKPRPYYADGYDEFFPVDEIEEVRDLKTVVREQADWCGAFDFETAKVHEVLDALRSAKVDWQSIDDVVWEIIMFVNQDVKERGRLQ